MDDFKYLKQALGEAQESVTQGGFPAGAVVVKDGVIVSEGISIGNILHDPTSHGELSAIRTACTKINSSDLNDATLYASMEPCSMCLSAAMWAGIKTIVFACKKERVPDAYYGGTYTTDILNNTFTQSIQMKHLPELEQESLAIVKDWEQSRNT